MRYDRPELRERLAADYVLGQMPPRARQRFEREMVRHATLAANVAAWSGLLAPLDATAREERPPAQVWRAIERRVAMTAPPPVQRRFHVFLFWRAFWRAFAITAVATCAALALYIALSPVPLSHTVQAFAEKTGIFDWAATAKHAPTDIGLSTITLGVSERERPRWLRAALLVANDAMPLTTTPPAQ